MPLCLCQGVLRMAHNNACCTDLADFGSLQNSQQPPLSVRWRSARGGGQVPVTLPLVQLPAAWPAEAAGCFEVLLLACCRYEVGLQKLLAAESEVNIMKEELIQLQPKLIATGKQVGCCLNISVRMLKC